MLQNIEDIIQFVNGFFVNIIFRIIHIVTSNALIVTVSRTNSVSNGRCTAALAVYSLVYRVIDRRRRKDGSQLVVFNNFYVLRFSCQRIPVGYMNSHGNTRCDGTVFTGNTRAAVLIDFTDFRTYGAEFK